MKALETDYNGIKFRSRLEARWAVLFDALYLEYNYEPECFVLSDGSKYTPDFFIPKYNLYIEIKPNNEWKDNPYHVKRYTQFDRDLIVLDISYPELGMVSNCNIDYLSIDHETDGFVFCPNSKYEPFFYSGLDIGKVENLFDYSKEIEIVKQHRFWN